MTTCYRRIKIIPHGAGRCHFTVGRWEDDGGIHPWDKYSEELARRAIDKMKGTDDKRVHPDNEMAISRITGALH